MLFVLILLLLAAAFGILGAVIKVTLVIVLSVILSFVLIGAAAALWFRSRMRSSQGQYRVETGGSVRPEDPGELED